MTTYSETKWQVCLLKDKDGNIIWEKIIKKPVGSDWRKKLKRLQDRHHREAKTLRDLEETATKLANLALEEPEETEHMEARETAIQNTKGTRQTQPLSSYETDYSCLLHPFSRCKEDCTKAKESDTGGAKHTHECPYIKTPKKWMIKPSCYK